ncbi:MAG: AAC(3)-I family aminoglycoside N-acetyltransferase [Pseudomonadota bacterium]
MSLETSPTYRVLDPTEVSTVRELLDVFSEAFEDPQNYTSRQPSDAYLGKLLERDTFFVVVAEKAGKIIGGLAAYELVKFEQERSEIYIYDLAVLDGHRRQGVATQLIETLKHVAAKRGAHVVFVQADYDDPPAIALYSSLGRREDVLHFDIEVP